MKVITVAGDDLFRIAAGELGDATQWIRIAGQIRITDPVLTGVTTLLIPDFNPNAGGGVAAAVISSPTSRAPQTPHGRQNDQVLQGATQADVLSNNYYAAVRFSVTAGLGADPWASAAFWASASDILVDVRSSVSMLAHPYHQPRWGR